MFVAGGQFGIARDTLALAGYDDKEVDRQIEVAERAASSCWTVTPTR